jgi:FkbM family methyltransferase
MTASARIDRPRTLFADALEAWSLGDRLRDKTTLVGALTMRKLGKLRNVPARSHVITIRSGGIRFSLDVWAAEHRPLREIIARDEYGITRGGLLAPGGLVVDVGANIGVFSLISALRVGSTGKVIAFEPHPRAFERLVRNVGQNDAGKVIVPINAAVSATAGTLSFDPDAVTVHNSVDRAGTTQVRALTLDDDGQVSQLHHIDVLKVDVEGHEMSVLQGAERTLLRTSAVVVEYQTNATREGVFDRLRHAGFSEFSETRYGDEDGLISTHR